MSLQLSQDQERWVNQIVCYLQYANSCGIFPDGVQFLKGGFGFGPVVPVPHPSDRAAPPPIEGNGRVAEPVVSNDELTEQDEEMKSADDAITPPMKEDSGELTDFDDKILAAMRSLGKPSKRTTIAQRAKMDPESSYYKKRFRRLVKAGHLEMVDKDEFRYWLAE